MGLESGSVDFGRVFDPSTLTPSLPANAARTKTFMTKWPIRKPLDFPPTLQTRSREEEK